MRRLTGLLGGVPIAGIYREVGCAPCKLQDRSIGTTATGTIDFYEEKCRKIKLEGDLLQIEKDVAEGKLVELPMIERIWSNQIIETRVNLLSVPARVVSSILGLTDEKTCKKLLYDEICLALTNLAELDPSRFFAE